MYYLAFPGDHAVLQCLVYGVYLVGTVQTGFAMHDFYLLYSTRYGYLRLGPPDNGTNWDSGVFFIVTIPICGSLMGCAVQLFYAHRVRLLTGGIFIPVLLAGLAALQWAGAIMVAAGEYSSQIQGNQVEHSVQKMNRIGYIGNVLWGSVSSGCDVFIATYMIYYLFKNKPTARHTSNRIFKLMRLILETNSLTATVSIAFVLSILFVPGAFFMIPGLAIGKVYAITLLVLLNNRFLIVGGRQKDEPSFLLPSEIVEVDTIPSSWSTSRFTSAPTTTAV